MSYMYFLREKKEDKNSEIDFFKEYLELRHIIIDMIYKYYSTMIDINYMLENKIKFQNVDLDYNKKKVHVCDHLYENAGELAFKTLNINNNVISQSNLTKIKKDLENELLEYNHKQKIKIKN